MMERSRQPYPLNLSYSQYKQRDQNLKGLTIGEYKVLKELGKGSFGKVYKVKNKEGAFFALKLLDKKQVRGEPNLRIKAIRERLIQSEPILMRQCDSRNLIKLFDIFENQDLKILIIQFCDGKTLADQLKDRKERNGKKNFSEKEAVDILRHIINGIAELHKHSIVHRDLKTQNIMKHEALYKIIDFGFSKKLQLSYQSEKTKNTVLGTPTTMAPQVMLHKRYGLKADIWSIGIIFFQLVFGSTPYDSSNAKAFYAEIEKRFSTQSLIYKGITLSADAHNFLKHALKVDPDKRLGWREMIEHPLIKTRSISERFVQRHTLKQPAVTQQLVVGSLILEVEEIKMKKQPEEEIHLPKDSERELLISRRNEKNEIKHQQPKKPPQNSINQVIFKAPRKATANNIDFDTLIQEEREAERQKKQAGRKQAERKLMIQMNQKLRQTVKADSFSTQLFKNEENRRAEREQDNESELKICFRLHLQCLKTQFIYEKLFQPIEQKKLLDLQKRQSIEFMHLLISRCFKNLSPLKLKLKSNPESMGRQIGNLYIQVQQLYSKVIVKFQDYDQKLLKIQNKYLEIAKDFFLKVVNSKSEKQKNTILGGIQLREGNHFSNFGDYTKAEQIAFTQIYIQKILQKIPEDGAQVSKIKKYLQFYNFIMSVTLQTLGEESFSELVDRIDSDD